MISRPVDSAGDILPVRSRSDLLSGAPAAAAGLRDHLNLFAGDWWEYADRGSEILDLLSLSRRRERDAETLSAYLTAYILAFPAIRSVSDIRASFSGPRFFFACTAHTETGETFPVSFQSQ